MVNTRSSGLGRLRLQSLFGLHPGTDCASGGEKGRGPKSQLGDFLYPHTEYCERLV